MAAAIGVSVAPYGRVFALVAEPGARRLAFVPGDGRADHRTYDVGSQQRGPWRRWPPSPVRCHARFDRFGTSYARGFAVHFGTGFAHHYGQASL